ncbi:hypothetical protein QR680_011085 [Steinernema hermaphroditum]|uniref:Peptidase S1 domain-containing protein n=1 Tax=Steinernema hermaphroditum TaxID=289476 RepID=A0AA39MCM2_9BILA|nr:hypothetical protein QR680_011085 [Steinernema hermaphroditum]
MRVLLEALLLFGLAATMSTKVPIVGPESRPSTPGDHPYFASLVMVSTNQKFCGGSIIGSRWILTAAHCLYYGDDNPKLLITNMLKVMVGHNTGHETFYNVRRMKLRTNSKTPNAGNDVAILETDRNITFNVNVQPICVAGFDIEAGEPALTMGFGTTIPNADVPPKKLLEIGGNIMSPEHCSVLHKFNNRKELCFLVSNGSPCSGDSGGPIVDAEQRFQHGLHHGVYGRCIIGRPAFGHRVSSTETCLFILRTTRGEVECRKEYEC